MEQRTIDALTWIVGILNEQHIEYQIAGGFAAKVYGSPRELHDIDIDIRDKDLSKIVPKISDYITFGPGRFTDGKFDCELISLTYKGQEIDISGTDTLRMSNKERTEWISYPNFSFDTLDIEVNGLSLKIVHPKRLIAYKREMDGEHQQVDIEAAQKYLAAHVL